MQKITEVKIKNLTCHELFVENEYIKFSCLDYGATITGIYTKEGNHFTNNVLKLANYDDYYLNPYYINCVIAPIPGRVANAKITIDKKNYFLEQNEGTNCLHFGQRSTAWRTFSYEVKQQEILLYTSILSEESKLPGNIDFQVSYRLEKDKLIVTYKAISDANTIFNATSHGYFNLNSKDIDSLSMKVNADVLLTLDKNNLPDRFFSVKDTPWDYTSLEPIGSKLDQLKTGLDNCYILKADQAIELYNPNNHKRLEISTDKEACVIYSGDKLATNLNFINETSAKRKGICFETQSIPNGMNNGLSNAWYLQKNEQYKSINVYRFTSDD